MSVAAPLILAAVMSAMLRGPDEPYTYAGNGALEKFLKVYDENWNLIDSDEDSSSVAVVSFTPRWTGAFHVRTIYYSGAPVGSLGFFIGYRQ